MHVRLASMYLVFRTGLYVINFAAFCMFLVDNIWTEV